MFRIRLTSMSIVGFFALVLTATVAKAGGAIAEYPMRSGSTLEIPANDEASTCENAASELARVTRHMRDAEITSYCPDAEDVYENGLNALSHGQYRQAAADMRAADEALRNIPACGTILHPSY